MPEKNVIEVGTVRLGTEDYRLARTEEFKQAWRQESVDEPPWQEGLPPLLSAEEETWHLGGFKSREGIAGTTEYGNTDCRWPFQMLPPPHPTTITLTDSIGPPLWIFEALDYIWAVTAKYIYRIHKTSLTVTKSKDVSTYQGGVMGLRWEEDACLVTTGAAGGGVNYNLLALYAIGTPDTWSNCTASARYLADGLDRLYKVNPTGLLRNVSTGLEPYPEDNYADKVQCGFVDTYPTGLLAFENTVLVGKPEGLFGVSADEGVGVPLVKRMARDDENCMGMHVVEPHVLVPHSRGLYRVRPGVSVESVGMEREVLNTTLMAKSRFRCFAVDNQWVYAGLEGPSGVTSYILVGRDRRQGEPGLGPLLWDTLIDLGTAAVIRAIHPSVLTAVPTLWYGKGNDVAYIKLPTGGGVPAADCAFAASGVRYSPRYNFGDWNDKDFPKAQMACKDVDSTHYWSLAYRIDDGSWATTDVDSVAMDVKSEGVKTFFFAVAAVGKEIQYRWTYTGPAGGPSAFGSLVYFKRFARPQSKKVPVIVAILHLAAGISHDMAEEGRDAITQFNDLNTLSEQAASVVSRGPWGEGDVRIWVRHIRLLETIQVGEGEPELLVEATLQKREAA